MNRFFKESLKKTKQRISFFFLNLSRTLVSLLRICVLCSVKVARDSRHYPSLKTSTSCCLLGNGPSLLNDIESVKIKAEGNDILCVNMFCSSPFFKELKPRFYFLIDETYFAPKNIRGQKLVAELIYALNSVDWDMFLVISYSSVSGGNLLHSINNEHIKIIKLNSAEFCGFRSIRHWVFRNMLGMPRCQTVVIFALCASINMGYKNVYLYGADHTWTRDLFVDENNVVCYGDRHVYNNNLTVIKKEGNFASLLDAFSNMFKSHYLIEEYSQSMGVKIWNCASDTFLDAYERLL